MTQNFFRTHISTPLINRVNLFITELISEKKHVTDSCNTMVYRNSHAGVQSLHGSHSGVQSRTMTSLADLPWYEDNVHVEHQTECAKVEATNTAILPATVPSHIYCSLPVLRLVSLLTFV
jgi:hypothetical protein